MLVLISAGLSNEEIAARCYLSINSVKTFIRAAYRKIGVERRVEAAMWVAEHLDTGSDVAVELQEQDDFPSAAQLERYRDAAPATIADEVDVVVGAFLEAIEQGDPTAAYADPAVEAAFGPIESFEADRCGIEPLP